MKLSRRDLLKHARAVGRAPEAQGRPPSAHAAAVLASSLAAKPEQWRQFWEQQPSDSDDPAEIVAQAIAQGWQAKWS